MTLISFVCAPSRPFYDASAHPSVSRLTRFHLAPDSQIPFTRWQAGRTRCIEVQMPDGHWQFDEAFELLAWAESSDRLHEKLADL